MGDKKKENKYEGTDIIIDYFLKNNQFEKAIRTAKNLNRRKVKIKYLIKILDFLLMQPSNHAEPILIIVEPLELLGHKINKERLETILIIFINRGWFDKAKQIAQLLKRKLDEVELKVIISVCLKKGREEWAIEAAKLLDEM